MKNQSELVRALRKELAAKEKELADQKWVFEQILQSPTWRWTAPVRALVNRLRSLNGQPAAGASASDGASSAPEVEATQPVMEIDPETEFKETIAAAMRSALDSFLASGAVLEIPESASPTISLILVLYNRAELTFACLRSIAEERGVEIEVVVVDNASSDLTSRLLERTRGVRIIRNAENRHFLLAANQAARECRGEYLLLLNNDAQLLPGALKNALTALQSAPDVGAVGAKILLLDGRLQEAGSIAWQNGSCSGYGRGDNPQAPMYNFRRDVDYCSGAFLLTPRALWERLAGFDEAYKPAYYEETDYCMRLWRAGKRVVYDPTCAILHYEFGSSQSSANATSLQAAHQALFAERHRDVLATRTLPSADALLRGRTRRQGKRVLFVDDRTPHLWLGSGFPRAQAFIRALLPECSALTLYPLAVIEEPWDVVYSDFPREVEVMTGWGISMLEPFFRSRANYYDIIVISRPHNMEHVLPVMQQHPEWFSNTKLVYDAEALFTAREIGIRKLKGDPMTPDEERDAFAKEVALSSGASMVVAVSEAEKQTFLQHGIKRVEVVGHSLETLPAALASREGLLFVGAIYDDASPNADSLIWFLSEIFPLIQARVRDLRLTIAGVNRSERIRQLAGDAVVIAGELPSLSDVYAAAKVFVAPTRFAAGIPHKIHEAAAFGLPVVATPLLAAQLSWTAKELSIAEDAKTFAHCCVELYTNPDLWLRQRDAALARVRAECSPVAFSRQVARILSD